MDCGKGGGACLSMSSSAVPASEEQLLLTLTHKVPRGLPGAHACAM